MAEQEITLLKVQREKLSEKSFELEGWKNQTLLLAQRIFGKEHPVIKMMGELKYDYSSWHLRDVTGNKETEDPVRVQARQILDAAISELETLGMPPAEPQSDRVWKTLEEELTGKQVTELRDILAGESGTRLENIQEKLNVLKKEDLVSILSRIMTGS
ncbi:MAG: hypothetical protein PHI28_09280 [Mangrovibacterium sp.]|nr:hypothetical protein [Mangrovibacterium sp.]